MINIRLRLCQLFPGLKSILKLPADRILLQSLELTVRKLIAQERDPDVSDSIRAAVIEMDRIEVAMETVSFVDPTRHLNTLLYVIVPYP